MNKKTKGIILIAVYGLIMIWDGYLTWIMTPSLSYEANPLVAIIGLGWGALIAANAITFLIYCAVVYFSYGVYKTPKIVADNEQELQAKLKNTDGKGHILAMVGYSISYSLIISRLYVVLEWILIYFRRSLGVLRQFARMLPGGRPDLVLGAVLTIIFAFIWMGREERDKRELAEIRVADVDTIGAGVDG